MITKNDMVDLTQISFIYIILKIIYELKDNMKLTT